MLKKFVQQGRRRVETGGVPSEGTLRISTRRERSWRTFSASGEKMLISHRPIELRQTRTRQRELGLYLDARRHQDRRMEHNIADRDFELRLLWSTQFD